MSLDMVMRYSKHIDQDGSRAMRTKGVRNCKKAVSWIVKSGTAWLEMTNEIAPPLIVSQYRRLLAAEANAHA
jgi:hypothetical protein